MQGQAGPFAGCPPRSRSAAKMDGCSRQNPAYRLATERPRTAGPLYFFPPPLPNRPSRVRAMRFGIFYEHQLPRPWDPDAEHRLLREALEQVEIADRLGFDAVWE